MVCQIKKNFKEIKIFFLNVFISLNVEKYSGHDFHKIVILFFKIKKFIS